jgi:phage recombination protein Bet
MANENAVTTVTEQNQITSKLLSDYFATLTDKLTDVQRNQFAAVAQAFGLNPFKREIYATTYRNKDGQTVMSIVTGYEVYLKRAEMNPNYNGFETNFQVVNGEMGCTCKVYRKDRTMPVTSTVWMSEYSTGRSLWASKPRMMLEKVAIATAFRRAFPCDFGGMPYTTDELPEHMTGADKLEQQGYTEVPQEPQTEAKQATSEKQKKENFVLAMNKLHEANPKVYEDAMKIYAYDKPEDVPADKRRDVFGAINDSINAAAQKE